MISALVLMLYATIFVAVLLDRRGLALQKRLARSEEIRLALLLKDNNE